MQDLSGSEAERKAFLEFLGRLATENDSLLGAAVDQVGKLGYAIPTVFNCAEVRANDAVDRVAPRGFADFSAIFRDVVTIVDRMLSKGRDFQLFLDNSPELDPDITRLFAHQHSQTGLLNESAAVQAGRLLVSKVGGTFRISIARSRRRNGLTLLRDKAMFLSYPPQTQKLVNSISRTQTVDDQSTDKSVRLTFQTTLEELAPLRKGNPKTWARLLDTLGITETGALSFLAFTNVLKKMPSRWYKSDHLFELLKSFCAAYHRPLVPRLEFDLLLELLSCAIKDARSTGVVIPFLRFGNWYRFWFFAYHVLIPGLVFISAIQRQYSEIWSRTFGSEMAVVADYIASLLPTSKKISIMTRREKKGLGDADLVIFDSSSNELLVCELKTVFDRFRTDFQSTNFTLQRVNFDKAIRQLDASCDAIADGRWPLKDLLPNDAIQTMPVIYKLIILWRDIPNPTLDKGSFVPVIDLASFVYLYKQCNGRPREIVETVEQLSKIYMASTYATQSLEVGGEKIEWMREVEIGGLPPLSFIRSLVVSYRTQQEYQTLAHLPEDWTTQLRPDEPSEAFHFRSDLSLNADVI